MDPNTFPTKGNLILAKNSLVLSRQGFELMDRKRNILIRELMDLIGQATDETVPIETSIQIKRRSVMGTEIPRVEYEKESRRPVFEFQGTRMSLDEAKEKFEQVKELTIRLAQIENSAYRLATNIKKTQKRANALQNITIPKFMRLTKDIQNALEEKEREEFTRLKVIKRMQRG